MSALEWGAVVAILCGVLVTAMLGLALTQGNSNVPVVGLACGAVGCVLGGAGLLLLRRFSP